MECFYFLLVVGISTILNVQGNVLSLSAELGPTLDQELLSSLDNAHRNEMTDAESNALAILKKEKTVGQIAEALKRRGVTMSQVFNIRSWSGLENRSNLPYIRLFIRDKVKKFHRLDLKTVFKLLGKIGNLLRVAYAGCSGSKCQTAVLGIFLKYQDLMTDSKTLSQNLVNVCIYALRFHRYSYYYLSQNDYTNSLKQLNRTTPLAAKIRDDAKKTQVRADEIKKLTSQAMLSASTELNAIDKNKFDAQMKALEKKNRELNNAMIKLTAEQDDIDKQIKKYKEDEAKVNAEEQMENTKSLMTTKCNTLTNKQFREVCSTKARSWWFKGKDTTCTLVLDNQQMREACHQEVSVSLVQLRRQKIKQLADRRQAFVEKRISNMEKKLGVQRQFQEQFESLKNTGLELKALKKEDVKYRANVEVAIKSLELAINSMAIVRTHLQKAIEFWDGVKKQSDELVKHAADNVDGLLKEKVLESGFSWIALGKAMRTAAIEMGNAASKIDAAVIRLPNSDEVNQIIEVEGKAIIDEARAQSKRYRDEMDETQEKIDSLQKEKDSLIQISVQVGEVVKIDEPEIDIIMN